LIKDLKVKGSSMVAKQGTAVRNIRLDHENADYIEGRVDGQTIVIITQYVKKI
jgi:protein PhnA